MARPVAGLNKDGVRSGGRKTGTPNKVTVDAKVLVSELIDDAEYQARLRRDFRKRRVHPSIESLVWSYRIGKPVQPVLHGGSMALDVSTRLADERQAFSQLPLADLEQLAAESQGLVNRALALARTAAGSTPDVVEGVAEDEEPPQNIKDLE